MSFKNIGERIKSAREKKGLSLTAAAAEIKLAASNLHRLESGKSLPTWGTLVNIAQNLKFETVDNMLGYAPWMRLLIHNEKVRIEQGLEKDLVFIIETICENPHYITKIKNTISLLKNEEERKAKEVERNLKIESQFGFDDLGTTLSAKT